MDISIEGEIFSSLKSQFGNLGYGDENGYLISILRSLFIDGAEKINLLHIWRFDQEQMDIFNFYMNYRKMSGWRETHINKVIELLKTN